MIAALPEGGQDWDFDGIDSLPSAWLELGVAAFEEDPQWEDWKADVAFGGDKWSHRYSNALQSMEGNPDAVLEIVKELLDEQAHVE